MKFTRTNARRELLARLLDAYERSDSFWAAAPWPREVSVSLPRKGAKPELEALWEAAEALERDGVVRVVRRKGPDGEPRALSLGSQELAAAMAAAGDAGLERLGEALEELAQTVAGLRQRLELPAAMAKWLERVEDGAREADLSPLGLTRAGYKRDRRDVADALTAAAVLSTGEKEAERALSQKLFGDPKRLGAIRERVDDFLRRAEPPKRRATRNRRTRSPR